tara:strand:+ start:472 stop:666 length:195 start_codon:yes stop_codon:yes gene_type:complete
MAVDKIKDFKLKRIHADVIDIAHFAMQSLDSLSERNYLDTMYLLKEKIDQNIYRFNGRPYKGKF